MDLDPTKVFFSADLHLGHGNILKYCRRIDFMNLVEKDIMERRDRDQILELRISKETIAYHDECLINNWNSVVPPDGVVFFLGDFAFVKSGQAMQEISFRLNGEIQFVLGNHDNPEYVKYGNQFKSVNDILNINVGGQKIILCHYAMRVWHQSHRGAYMLYGHSHNQLEDDPKLLSIDVGIDTHWPRIHKQYFPYSFKEIQEIMVQKQSNKLLE